VLIRAAGLEKYQFYNYINSRKRIEQKKQRTEFLALKLFKCFTSRPEYGSLLLAKLFNKSSGECKVSKYVIDSIKHYIRKNPIVQGKKIDLTPNYVKRMIRKAGITKSGKFTKKYKGNYMLKTLPNDLRYITFDASEITEIKLPFRLYVTMFLTGYQKILCIVVSDVNNSETIVTGLLECMSRLVKTKDYIAHSDNGSENLNDDVQ
jgi:hypothetical protein